VVVAQVRVRIVTAQVRVRTVVAQVRRRVPCRRSRTFWFMSIYYSCLSPIVQLRQFS